MAILPVFMRPLVAAAMLIAGLAAHDVHHAVAGAHAGSVGVARSFSISEIDRGALLVADVVTGTLASCPAGCAGGCVSDDLAGCCAAAMLPGPDLAAPAMAATVWRPASSVPSGIDRLTPTEPPRLNA
ncbi:MAG: hypothetical protein WD036_05640 [Bauldia sp.]